MCKIVIFFKFVLYILMVKMYPFLLFVKHFTHPFVKLMNMKHNSISRISHLLSSARCEMSSPRISTAGFSPVPHGACPFLMPPLIHQAISDSIIFIEISFYLCAICQIYKYYIDIFVQIYILCTCDC